MLERIPSVEMCPSTIVPSPSILPPLLHEFELSGVRKCVFSSDVPVAVAIAVADDPPPVAMDTPDDDTVTGSRLTVTLEGSMGAFSTMLKTNWRQPSLM
jgi:hypothetical protein